MSSHCLRMRTTQWISFTLLHRAALLFLSVASPWSKEIAIRAAFTCLISYISAIRLLLCSKANLIIWNRPATNYLIILSCNEEMQREIWLHFSLIIMQMLFVLSTVCCIMGLQLSIINVKPKKQKTLVKIIALPFSVILHKIGRPKTSSLFEV